MNRAESRALRSGRTASGLRKVLSKGRTEKPSDTASQ